MNFPFSNAAFDLKNGSGSVKKGKLEKADCTFTISDSDVMAMFAGKLDPQQVSLK